MWPNLFVLELAPTTAKKGDAKKVLMEASVDMLGRMGVENGYRVELAVRYETTRRL